MTAILIALGVVLFLLAVYVQSIALARAAARGDAMLRRAVAVERSRADTTRHRDPRRVAA
jgi:hypothetical protein